MNESENEDSRPNSTDDNAPTPSSGSNNEAGGEGEDVPGASESHADADLPPEAIGESDADPLDGADSPDEDMDDEEIGEEDQEEDPDEPQLPLVSVVEAVLFAARAPLKPAQIARAAGRRTRQEAVRAAIEELNVHYLETARAFEIADLSGSYQLMSRPEYVKHILRIYPKKDLAEREKSVKLTPAALDTLAIIAYKQPVTRGEIEHIRGVGCGAVLRALIERGTVKVAGKRTDLVGQPLMYGTTDSFLAEFGMGSLDELPHRHELLEMAGGEEPGVVE